MRRFSGAGLGGADQVVPAQRGRDRRLLNGSRRFITGAFDPRLQAWIEFELFEVHKYPVLQKSGIGVWWRLLR